MKLGALADHNIVSDQSRVYCSKCERRWADIMSQPVACSGNLLNSEREAIEAERDRIWRTVRDVADGSAPAIAERVEA